MTDPHATFRTAITKARQQRGEGAAWAIARAYADLNRDADTWGRGIGTYATDTAVLLREVGSELYKRFDVQHCAGWGGNGYNLVINYRK